MFVFWAQCSNSHPVMRYQAKHHMGRMWSKDYIKLSWEGELIGFDNGAFSAWRKGEPFPADHYRRRLDQLLSIRYQNTLVAVCPDIVAGGAESLEFSLRWREQLPDCLPWYLAVQDGIEPADVEPHIDRFCGIFLGGTNHYKRRAAQWAAFAWEHRVFFHWARCVQINAIREARAIGVNSIDSAAPVLNMANGRHARARNWIKVAMGQDNQGSMF